MRAKSKKNMKSARDLKGPSSNVFARLAYISALALLGAALSYLQPFGLTPDYEQYSIFFDLVRQEQLEVFNVSRFEPGFAGAALVLTYFCSTNIAVFSSFVFLCLLSKFIAISALSKSLYSFLIAALVYLVCFFPLHELTQLRVACSTSFVFLVVLLISRNRIVLGSVAGMMAIAFHYSIVALIPFLYCKVRKFGPSIGIVLLTYLLLATNSQSLTLYLQSKFQTVAQMGVTGFGERTANPLNAFNIIKIVAVILAIVNWSHLSSLMKQVVLIQLVSLGIFYSMIDYPVVAFRIFEAFSTTWVVFIADGSSRKNTYVVCLAIACLYCGVSAYIFFFDGRFFSPF